MNRKERLGKAQALGSEGQKVRDGAVTVLEPVELDVETSPPAEVRPDGRPPKPSEDAEECPNWEKGRHRSKPWLRCQGWSLNGFETCRNCYQFQQQAPIFQGVDLGTITKVVFNAQNALRGVVEPFKRNEAFSQAWDEDLEDILNELESEHEKRARDYSSLMRRVQKVVREIFAKEAKYLHDQCSSWADSSGGNTGAVHTDFHEWEEEVKEEAERAEINGEYSRWIFLGDLRYLFRERVEGKNLIEGLRGRHQQGPRRNDRNGGNGRNGGWNSNNGWRPRR